MDRKKQAKKIFMAQKYRCGSKKCHDYNNYGGKGLSVSYSKDEFVKWWLEETKDKPNRVHCGRIDHEKGYFFGNIQVETPSENSKEMLTRNINPGHLRAKRVFVFDAITGVKLSEHISLAKAALSYNVSQSQVCINALGRKESVFGKWKFSYKENSKQ